MARFFKALCIAATIALIASAPARAGASVVVSSKLSSESAMIGEMIRLVLSAAGIPTVDRLKLGATPVVRRALLDGEVDLYVEYTGNGGIFFNLPADPAWKDFRKGYELGARLDYTNNRIVWLTPAPASNAWALAVRKDVADAYHLRTMSDFARWVSGGGQVMLACSAEFANAGTLRSLEHTYGFRLTSDQLIVLAGGETTAMITAAAARTNGTNTAMVYATDGGIAAANLVVLEDDKHDQPIYAPVPLIRAAVLRAHPEIAALVKPLMESLDRQTLQRLNERVQVDGEAIESVARAYLDQKRLWHKDLSR
ncbi:MAG TPA: glycine betaine ABC transporter substrate-binding protein [Steroidobacteraceae bacterium]|nr:glycine betaine ABC transporter substrate-binding protein [Steroidobacteraceae bacterium]